MLSRRIKLRHLQAFLEVARHRSFARAAERLAISQPGMSKAIRELEEILGTSLFDRTPQGVALTQAGLTLLRHAGPAMRALEEGVGALDEGLPGANPLRIGALSTVESRLLPAAIQRWHTRQEKSQLNARVTVTTGPSAYLLSRLRQGELDLVVGRMTAAREIQDLTFEHLYYEPLVLVARRDHPLARATLSDATALLPYPWILPPPNTTLRQQVDSFCVRHGVTPPRQLLETLSLSLSRRYTSDSNAIWVAPLESVLDALDSGQLVRLDLPLETEGGSVGLCMNVSLPTSPALTAFCDIVRTVAKEHAINQHVHESP